ncbi:MAG: hypothetical protein BWY70_01451 [Bacteroidetes bacterium ADurb.Bin408]|nr:MAG: hypothetical protein BWY70_01451 [Bacteroidetes bacterium ADurb.Bin408]
MNFISNINTNTGQRLIATYDNLLGSKWIQLFDPFNSGANFPALAMDSMNSCTRGMFVAGDTVYYGKKIGSDFYLVAQRAYNDTFVFLDTIKLTMTWGNLSSSEIMGISVENGIVAVGYGPQFALFDWTGGNLHEMFVDFKPTQRIMDIELKNNLAYVADRFYGMKIYDVSSHTQAVLVAETKGTGGWTNVFGSTAITVDNNGAIYLSDFHAGVFIIEAYDTTLISVPEAGAYSKEQAGFTVIPNPATNYFTVQLNTALGLRGTNIYIYDILGREILKAPVTRNTMTFETTGWEKGMYFIKWDNNRCNESQKIIVR